MAIRRTFLLGVLCNGVCCALSLGSPAIPTTYTLTGTIDDVSWHPRKLVRKGIPDMSGSLGYDKYAPARYVVKLSNVEFGEAKDEFSRAEVEKLKNAETLTLTLRHEKDDGFLAVNMRITIVDYTTEGDEGGYWHSFKKIDILEPPGVPPDGAENEDVQQTPPAAGRTEK